MNHAVFLALVVIGVSGASSSVQAQNFGQNFGRPSYQSFEASQSDEASEDEETTDDDIEAYLGLLMDLAQPQRSVSANGRGIPGTTMYPPQPIRQGPYMAQPQKPSTNELLQLLAIRKQQAAYLQRQHPILKQQADSYRQTSEQMGISGHVMQQYFDNQVRICEIQYSSVLKDIQSIEAHLRGLGR